MQCWCRDIDFITHLNETSDAQLIQVALITIHPDAEATGWDKVTRIKAVGTENMGFIGDFDHNHRDDIIVRDKRPGRLTNLPPTPSDKPDNWPLGMTRTLPRAWEA